jgi:hypothetical protein
MLGVDIESGRDASVYPAGTRRLFLNLNEHESREISDRTDRPPMTGKVTNQAGVGSLWVRFGEMIAKALHVAENLCEALHSETCIF